MHGQSWIHSDKEAIKASSWNVQMPVSVAVNLRKTQTQIQNTNCYTWLNCECKIIAFVCWRTGQWSLTCSAVEEKERLDVFAASSSGQPFVSYV